MSSSSNAAELSSLSSGNVWVVDGANSRVGVNTTSPSTTLDVIGIVSATSFQGDGSALTGISGGLADVVDDPSPQLGGNLDLNNKKITGTGGIDVVGVVSATKLHVGVGTGVYTEDLVVQGDARITGILTIGTGSITIDPLNKEITGINDIVVGSGASLSLAPLLNNKGSFVVDYSKVIIKGYNPNLTGTYNRNVGFVLWWAYPYTNQSRFLSANNYYYFLHESDNSKILIYSIINNYWWAIYSNGSDFSSPQNNGVISPVTNYALITPGTQSYDNTYKLYPSSGSQIEYPTTVVGRETSLGVADASSIIVSGNANVSGILTASVLDRTHTTITSGIVTTLVSNNYYSADTSSGIITAYLPQNPSQGDYIVISDNSGSFGINTCFIVANQSATGPATYIQGSTTNLEADVQYATASLTYTGFSTTGWLIK
jgi:hypothetical protein